MENPWKTHGKPMNFNPQTITDELLVARIVTHGKSGHFTFELANK